MGTRRKTAALLALLCILLPAPGRALLESTPAQAATAAAMQDYDRRIIVGEPTYGKGSVQQTFDLNHGAGGRRRTFGQLVLTVAQYFRVSGAATQQRGIEPDIRMQTSLEVSAAGERSEPNALPWEQIAATEFRPHETPLAVAQDVLERHRDRQRAPLFRAAATLVRQGSEQRRVEDAMRRHLGLPALRPGEPSDGRHQRAWSEAVREEIATLLADTITVTQHREPDAENAR